MLLTILFIPPVSAETLEHFRFRQAQSWNKVPGEACLVPILKATKIDSDHYQIIIQIEERGGISETVDKILIHIFDYDLKSEDDVSEAKIVPFTIAANGNILVSEVVNITSGQWVGYEFIVGEKNFVGICQCGKVEVTNQEEIEEEAEQKEESEAALKIKTVEELLEGLEVEEESEDLEEVADSDEDLEDEEELNEDLENDFNKGLEVEEESNNELKLEKVGNDGE